MTKINPIQAIRGMNDLLPAETIIWQHVEKTLKNYFTQYGYQEIRLPIVEKTELFRRGIGEVTDIVEKEMYTFLDRSNDSLTLRPEGTAGCVRAAIEHGMLYHQTQKLWYMGPMFRHERPQKGRYRQFYHAGVEIFGFDSYLAEAELIILMERCFKALELTDKVTLQLNSLGSVEARLQYREKFVHYCEKYVNELDEDSQRRLKTNPLRILDSKNPDVQKILENAPQLNDFIDDDSKQHLEKLSQLLNECHIRYEINSRLVRGLDYYTGTVFEWVTEHLGAQSTVCAGGRYDNLVEELGGPPTKAVGLAAGLERIIELSQLSARFECDGYFIFTEETAIHAIKISEILRGKLPDIKLEMNLMPHQSIKAQFKRADKSQARFALVLGEDENRQNMITFKDLRQNDPQRLFALSDLIQHLLELRSSL